MMSRCQHCGQGAIAQDANGPVCPDCWEDGRYETANPMTPDKQALTDLLAKVEAGDNAGFRKANRAVFSTPCQDMALQLREEHSRHAYKGSLDAAKSLHEAMLGDGFNYCIHSDSASVMTWAHTVIGQTFSARDKKPARAWLIAIIKALIAECDA